MLIRVWQNLFCLSKQIHLFIIILTMQINFDQYIRNFRIFYQQLVKGHQQEDKLNKNIKLLLQHQTKKWKKTFGFNKKITENVPETQSLKKVRELRKGKQKANINVQALHTCIKIQNCIVFGYIYLLFETKNISGYELLTETLNLFFSSSEECTAQMKRKLNYAWGKFDQYIYNKKVISIRYDKLLVDYYKDIPQVVIDYFFKSIFPNITFNPDKKADFFKEISTALEINLIYFEVNGSNVSKIEYIPEKKTSIKIGYLDKEQKYINVSKVPQKQVKQIKNEITYDKFAQISLNLQQMYSKNMNDYLNLNNLKNRLQNQFQSLKKIQNNSSLLGSSSRQSRDKFSEIHINIRQVTHVNGQELAMI